MEKRLSERSHECELEAVVYEHGTHFVFPETLLKKILPVSSSLFIKLFFSAAKEYPKECKKTRINLDECISKTIKDWKKKY